MTTIRTSPAFSGPDTQKAKPVHGIGECDSWSCQEQKDALASHERTMRLQCHDLILKIDRLERIIKRHEDRMRHIAELASTE